MSTKRILFWTTNLIGGGGSVLALASCSCTIDIGGGGETEEEIAEPTNKQFTLTRISEDNDREGLHIHYYSFTLGGFKVTGSNSNDGWNASATLIVGDDNIPLSFRKAEIDSNNNMTITLVSEEWNELIAISSSDTPYQINNLTISHNGKKLLSDKGGYSVLIKTGFAGPTIEGAPIDFSEVFTNDNTTYYFGIPTYDDTSACFQLCNASEDISVEDIGVDVHLVNPDPRIVFALDSFNEVDDPQVGKKYYASMIATIGSTASLNDTQTSLEIKIYDKNNPDIIYYENDGLGTNDQFIYTIYIDLL